MKFRGLLTGGALALALTLSACGGGEGGNTGGTDGGAAGGGTGGATTITIGTDKAAELVFIPETAEAPANTPVQLIFNNQSDSQPHNLVFQEGITAKTSDLVAAGASETLEFTTPGAGEYTFVCTIHPGMDGVLTVK
jgi:plastocyanin